MPTTSRTRRLLPSDTPRKTLFSHACVPILGLGLLVTVNIAFILAQSPTLARVDPADPSHRRLEGVNDEATLRGDERNLLAARGPKFQRRLAKDGPLAIKDAEECIAGYGGDSAGGQFGGAASDANPLVTTHGTLDKPIKPATPIFPCVQYSENTCCTNVLAEEINMGYEHFFDTGGSGAGRPRNSQVCKLHALSNYRELNEYFCLFCNPKQAHFFGCCDTSCPMTPRGRAVYAAASGSSADKLAAVDDKEKEDGTRYSYERALATRVGNGEPLNDATRLLAEADVGCDDPTSNTDDDCGMYHRQCGQVCYEADATSVYADPDDSNKRIPGQTDLKKNGEGTCNKDNVNVIRVCESFADAAYDKNKDTTKGNIEVRPGKKYDECGNLIWIGGDFSPKNPSEILTWGDVDGRSGDDPVIPSKLWPDFLTFGRDTKPPLFDEFVVIVVPDSTDCFAGRDNHFLDEFPRYWG
jgi:hypothetical protein